MIIAKPMDIDALRRVYQYNPETGKVTSINGRRNEIVKKDDGYAIVILNGKHLKCHRVAWALYYGEQPPNSIDHINGNPVDNRICNLRAATHQENMRNRRNRPRASSGVMGVSWDKAVSKWTVRVGKKRIGRFLSLEDAAKARAEAVKRIFGEFAPGSQPLGAAKEIQP